MVTAGKASERLSVSNISNTAHKAMNEMAQSMRGVQRQVTHSLGSSQQMIRSSQELEVSLKHLPLALTTAASMLYIQGRESVKALGDPLRATKQLAEAAVIYGLMVHTHGVLPLALLGTVAYRAGQQPTSEGKVSTAINAASGLGMSYVGALAGLHYAMQTTENQAHQTLTMLKDDSLMKAFDPRQLKELLHTEALKGEDPKAVIRQFAAVRRVADKTIRELTEALPYLKAPNSIAVYAKYRSQIAATLVRMSEALDSPVVRQALQGAHDVISEDLTLNADDAVLQARKTMTHQAQGLIHRLTLPQRGYMRHLNAAGPVFGAMLASIALGVPLAKFLHGAVKIFVPGLNKIDEFALESRPLWLAKQFDSNGSGSGGVRGFR